MTALLHELGAIDLPAELLRRTDPLDEIDKTELSNLPLYSIRRLMEFPLIGHEGIARIVSVFENCAHSRTNNAYQNEFVPDVRAQIIAVADAYDHLITPRMGKAALQPDQARALSRVT